MSMTLRTKLLILIAFISAAVWGYSAFVTGGVALADFVGYCKGAVLAVVALVLRDMPAAADPFADKTPGPESQLPATSAAPPPPTETPVTTTQEPLP